jgi:hypothetical protein
MRKHPGCVTDPLTRQWWHEYQGLVRARQLDVAFTEYVAHRTIAEAVTRPGGPVPVLTAACGHMHAWGQSCSSLTI